MRLKSFFKRISNLKNRWEEAADEGLKYVGEALKWLSCLQSVRIELDRYLTFIVSSLLTFFHL